MPLLLHRHPVARLRGLKQPIQHAARFTHAIHAAGPAHRGRVRVFLAPHQHQTRFGPRHGHIEHARAFRPFGAALLQGDRALQQRRTAGARFFIDIAQTKADFSMQADGAGLSAAKQRSAQAHHIDRGKFQPLGFVNGHHAHHVFPGVHHGRALLAPAAAIGPDGFHKAIQAVRMVPLIVVGAVAEHAQVGLPQLSARLRPVMRIKPAALEKAPQVFCQRHAARIEPLRLKRLQHGAAARGKRRVGFMRRRLQRAEEARLPLGAQKANRSQLPFRHLKQRAAQLADQGHVVGQVIQQGQMLNHLVHLVGRHGVAPAFAVHGNAHPAQHQLHLVGHIFAHRQQNGDITIVKRRTRLALCVGDRFAHRLQNIPRDQLRLGQDHVLRSPALRVEHMQLGRRVPLRRHAGVQPRVGVIVDLGDAPVHHMCKHAVHRIQHRCPAAKVQIEHHPAKRRVRQGRKTRQLPQKQAGLGQAEAVDALFYVAYIEIALACLAFEGVEDGLLQGAHVLVFVHEHRVEPLRLLLAQVRVAQHSQRHVLQVAKVDASFAELAFLKALMQMPDRRGQPARGAFHGLHIGHALFKIRGQQFFQIVCHILDTAAQVLKGPRQPLLIPGSGFEASQGDELQVCQRPAQRTHPLLAGRAQPAEGCPVALQRLKIGRREGCVCARGGRHAFDAPDLSRAFLQPGHRVRARHQKAIERLHHERDLALAEFARQGLKPLILVRRPVQPVQRFFHRVLPIGGAGPLIRQHELRVHAAALEVLPHHLLAIAMDCGDLRHTNQVRLAGQARVLHGGLVQARFQALPHLAGGGARKGDDQHPVDADAALHNQPHDALYQHGGLAAARRGRYQQLAVVGADGRFLSRGKAHVHRSFLGWGYALLYRKRGANANVSRETLLPSDA